MFQKALSNFVGMRVKLGHLDNFSRPVKFGPFVGNTGYEIQPIARSVNFTYGVG